MNRIASLLAAAFPAFAYGGVLEVTPAPHSYTVVDIDYWGTVTGVTAGTRRVGDDISGSMRIDTRFAPNDFWDWIPAEGQYIWNFPCERGCPPLTDAPSRFVTTRGAPVELGGRSWDEVYIFDKQEGTAVTHDSISIRDWEDGTGDSLLTVSLSARSSVVDFLRGDGLLQDFDLRVEEAGGDTAASGRWAEAANGIVAFFDFAIDRLRATPKVCRI